MTRHQIEAGQAKAGSPACPLNPDFIWRRRKQEIIFYLQMLKIFFKVRRSPYCELQLPNYFLLL
jgi:hypothetical protein